MAVPLTAAAGDRTGDAASITLTAAARDRCGDAASITHTAEPDADVVLTYLDILRDLGNQGAAVNSALLEAHTADNPQRRRAALVELHAGLRRMAATANAALGPATQPAEHSHA
jgi:hypothetical protein